MELEFHEAPNLHQKETIQAKYGRFSSLPEIEPSLLQCEGCSARMECQGPLLPRGPLTAEVVFIVRNPTHEDERLRRLLHLFTWGGGMFQEMLTLMGLQREDIYLTSSLFCHTRGYRTPHPRELVTCFGWKYWEFSRLNRAKIIIPMGDDALYQLMGFSFPSTLRSFWSVYRTDLHGRETYIIPGQHLHHLQQKEELIRPTLEWCRRVGEFILKVRGGHMSSTETVVYQDPRRGVIMDGGRHRIYVFSYPDREVAKDWGDRLGLPAKAWERGNQRLRVQEPFIHLASGLPNAPKKLLEELTFTQNLSPDRIKI